MGKLEASIKTMSEELMKANEIIKKFQGDIKNYHSKLKLRDQVNIEQEKLLSEKNKEMEEVRRELEQAKTSQRDKEDEVKKLNENLQVTMQKLEESRQLLKTNENVINWLNKQVTENQLGGRGGPGAGAFEMNSVGGPSGPSSRQLHNYSVPGYGPGSARLSTSIRSEPPPSHSHPSAGPHHPSHAPPRPGSGQFVQYQPGAKSGIALSLQAQKSSPVIGAIQEERQSPQASPHHPSNQSKPRVSAAEPIIDQRYLTRTDEPPLASRSLTPTSTSLHFTSQPHSSSAPQPHFHPSQQPSLPSAHNPTRLSKDAILNQRPPSGGAGVNQFSHGAAMGHAISPHGVSNGMGKPGGAQPPLASAYFPSKGKVT